MYLFVFCLFRRHQKQRERGKIGSNHVLHFHAPNAVAVGYRTDVLREIQVHVAARGNERADVDCRPDAVTRG